LLHGKEMAAEKSPETCSKKASRLWS